MLVWAELKPLWIVWELFVDYVPVNVVEVTHNEVPVVDTQVHACCNVFEEVGVSIPHPELVWIMFDVLFEVALNSWPFREVRVLQVVIILTAENQVLSHVLGDME